MKSSILMVLALIITALGISSVISSIAAGEYGMTVFAIVVSGMSAKLFISMRKQRENKLLTNQIPIDRELLKNISARRKEELKVGRRLDTKRFIKSPSFKVLNIIFLVYSAIILYIFLESARARKEFQTIIQKSPIGELCDFCEHATPAISSIDYVKEQGSNEGITAYVCIHHSFDHPGKISAIWGQAWHYYPLEKLDKLRTDVCGWSIFSLFMYLFAVLWTRGDFESRPGKSGEKGLEFVGIFLLLLIVIPAAIMLLSDLAEILSFLN